MENSFKILSPVLKSTAHGHYAILCPACGRIHVLDSRWKFNGNIEKPTFTPSLLIKEGYWEDTKERHTHRCHSFITNGKIKFLNDCTHVMAGKEINLPKFVDDDINK